MKFSFLFTFFLIFCVLSLSAAADSTDDKNGDGKADVWIEYETNEILCLKVDTNFDGEIDYLLKTTEGQKKIYEEIDYNFDGSMDDFYFYTDGVLERREVDSNYDTKVDIWVYLSEGLYIYRYARDTDYDGVIDLEKNYEEEAGN